MTPGRDIALTGIPRAGTTLACRLLGLAEATVALFEPIDVAGLPEHRQPALAAVDAWFAQARNGLLRDGTAPSKVHEGTVPDNPFATAGPDGMRRQQARAGVLHVAPPPAPGFTLVVKHNAAFTALLPELAQRRDTYAVVRNPLAVLGSWQSLRLPVSEGRLPAGERLDPALGARLGAAPDRLARQLAILDWCFQRFASALPRERVLRYEDVVASQGQSLFHAVGLRGASDRRLDDRNASGDYRGLDVDAAEARLLAGAAGWRTWYDEDAIVGLAARMRDQGAGA